MKKILLGLFLWIINYPINLYAQVPVYLEYPEVIKQLKVWNNKYADVSQLACYGYSKNNNPIYCFRININNKPKKKVLIIAAIHGNESLSTSMCLGYAGYILYHKNDKKIEKILVNRDLYFTPVCSPDSYIKHLRETEGVDPNRNFDDKQPCAPVAALKVLFNDIKPQACMSIHTYARAYLIPHGYTMKKCSNYDDYMNIVGQMSQLSNYKILQGYQLYKQPIYGTEMDYFHNKKCFSIVAEVGVNQKKSKWIEIENEFYKTFPAFLLFLEEAPKIKISK